MSENMVVILVEQGPGRISNEWQFPLDKKIGIFLLLGVYRNWLMVSMWTESGWCTQKLRMQPFAFVADDTALAPTLAMT